MEIVVGIVAFFAYLAGCAVVIYLGLSFGVLILSIFIPSWRPSFPVPKDGSDVQGWYRR